MRHKANFGVTMIVLGLFLCVPPSPSADVSPGETIDDTNWEKAKDLLPEAVLNWVKKGEFVLDIGELEVTPREMFPPHALESLKANVGRYDLDDEGWVIEKKTGERPSFILGFPFPKIDLNDPKSGEKVMVNKAFTGYNYGAFRFNLQLIWVGGGGYEREVELETQQLALTGYPGADKIPNPEDIEKYSVIVVRSPYDIAGTAVLTYRFLDPAKRDNTFGYVPAIRRVRRMSAANRSDTFVGSDECVDDASGYDGKVHDFEWKILREQEALMPFLDSRPFPIVQNKRGEWQTTKDIKVTKYGYETEGWQGAPWAPTNFIWTKRPMYVIEMKPKDRYYNYGTQHIWIEQDTYTPVYKIIHDRSGAYWKTFFMSLAFSKSADGKMSLNLVPFQNIVDERSRHSTATEIVSPRNIWTMFANVDPNDFTFAGFQKYCK